MAAIHLLAENLEIAATMLGQRAKQHLNDANEKILVAPPTGEDGVTFRIRAYSMEQWRSERSRVTGEIIKLS